jgi:hypothetical protein
MTQKEHFRPQTKKLPENLEVSRKLSIFAVEISPCMQITWVSCERAT